MEYNRSLKGLMRINRGKFFYHTIHTQIPDNPPIDNPVTPIITPDNPPVVTGYSLSDFGENAINNHIPSDAWHSEKNQTIFDYVTSAFRDRCTSYQSYKTAPYNGFVGDEIEACKLLKADIVYTPYVNSAIWTNTDNDNFILTVGSHYNNDGSNNIAVGSDNNRHDITPNATTFLSDSIAVSARRDTPELFKNSTSEGYGMEFFVDCSPEALDPYYPNKDIPVAFAELVSADGLTFTSNVHPSFTGYIQVGEEISIHHHDKPYETAIVVSINSLNSFTVDRQLDILSNISVYGWHNITLGNLVSQQESWAVPIVAGKLKVIKMSTNSDWETVRMAARATAKRNPTGISEIDNTNWDIYRGFGDIQIQPAIDFINNLNS